MSKRGKDFDWSKITGASPKPKRLHLEEDEEDGFFHCPVQTCDHDAFTTQRGCRKHVKKKHHWFYYFDDKPNLSEITSNQDEGEAKTETFQTKKKPCLHLTSRVLLVKNLKSG
jgi:uncharacterized C2H2 Zn-finger protein